MTITKLWREPCVSQRVEALDRGLSSPLSVWIVVLIASGAEAPRSRGLLTDDELLQTSTEHGNFLDLEVPLRVPFEGWIFEHLHLSSLPGGLRPSHIPLSLH
jgi:hypothetical protein